MVRFQLSTRPGLKFDRELLTAKAGEKVLLVFRNDDDMLHKFRANCAVGGLDAAASERLRSRLESLFDLPEIGANALSSNP